MTPPHAIALVALLASALIVMAAAATTSGSRMRRVLGVTLGVTAILPAWLVPPEVPLLRGVTALTAFVGVMRVIDLRHGRWTLATRLTHAMLLVDSRRVVSAPRKVDLVGIIRAMLWLTLSAGAYLALPLRSSHLSIQFWLERWGTALIVVYAGVAAAYGLIGVAYAAGGFATPPLHVSPALARSVQELWGERWARPISAWLAETFMRPLARRRHPTLGVLLAFVASAVFHAYVVWVALGFVAGLTMAASTLAYFVVQAPIVAMERGFGVRRWRPWAAHAWTVVWMLGVSPLFLEPLVRILGSRP